MLNITKNKLVDDFIKLSELFFWLQNKGERANYHDLSEILTNEEINEIVKVQKWRGTIERFIYDGNNDRRLCFCGSSKNYSNCHGKMLVEMLKKTPIKKTRHNTV